MFMYLYKFVCLFVPGSNLDYFYIKKRIKYIFIMYNVCAGVAASGVTGNI